jgi:hypothetical protein
MLVGQSRTDLTLLAPLLTVLRLREFRANLVSRRRSEGEGAQHPIMNRRGC